MLRVIGHSAFAGIAALGLVFAAPLAAEARDDHRGRHGHFHRGGHHDGGGHHARKHHRGHHGPRHGYPSYRSRHDYDYDYDYSYAPRYRRSVVVHSPFYCAPCGYGFAHRRAFHGHLTGHHGIAAHALSSVIVHTLRGLFYYGY